MITYPSTHGVFDDGIRYRSRRLFTRLLTTIYRVLVLEIFLVLVPDSSSSAASPSVSWQLMGSVPVDVQRLLHHLLSVVSVPCWAAQFLQICSAPLHNIVRPLPVSTSSLVLLVHLPKTRYLWFSVIGHAAHICPKSCSFLPVTVCEGLCS